MQVRQPQAPDTYTPTRSHPSDDKMSSTLSFDPAEDLPYMKCPLHTVLKLTPVAYGRSDLSLNRKTELSLMMSCFM